MIKPAFDFDAIKIEFLGLHIQFDDEWLHQCVEWINEEFPNSTKEDIKEKIIQEWIRLDFCEVGLPILPPNINDAIETTLTEPLYLQLVYVLDISKSKYSQLTNLRSRFNDDHMETRETSGILKLVLTDGVQEISALEYKKIDCLNVHMPPGMKLFFKPPITVRRGHIFLEPGMVEVTGGEVLALQIRYCQENVLCHGLGLPLNNNPFGDEIEYDENGAINVQGTETNTRDNNADAFFASRLQEQEPIEIEDDLIVQNEEVTPKYRTDTNSEFNDSLDFADVLNDEFFETRFAEIELQQGFKEMHNGTEATIQKPQPPQQQEAVSGNPAQSPPQPAATLSPPKRCIIPIAKLNKIRSNVTKGFFTVNAEIEDVTQKMQISEDGCYTMRVIICDGTDEIEVDMHSDVITKLIEHTPEALSQWKDTFRVDPVAKEEFLGVMTKFSEKLNMIRAHFVITVTSKMDPIITDMLDYTLLTED